MNEGDTPNDVDAEKPVFFSSEDSAKSASGHSLFASGNSFDQPQAPITTNATDATDAASPIKPTAPAEEDNSLAAIAPRRRSAPSTPDFFSNAMAAQAAPPPKPKRSPLLIVGIVAAVLLIGGLVAAAFLLPRGSSGKPVNNLEAKFNTFANYLLFGEEKTDKLPEYDADKVYRIDEVYSDSAAEGATDYIDKLNTLFDDFVQSYHAESSNSEAIDSYINNYSIIRYSFEEPTTPEENIVQSYLSGGATAASALIDDYYNNSPVANSPLATNYRKIDDGFVEILTAYAQSGCIIDAALDEECIDAISTENYQTLLEAEDALIDELQTKTQAALDAVTQDVWSVSSAMEAKK